MESQAHDSRWYLLMGCFMFLVGGIQARLGEWSDTSRSKVWDIADNQAATTAVIVCSYLFVCRTYPPELAYTKLFPALKSDTPFILQSSLRIRGKAVSLATAANWTLNTALAFAVPPGLSNIGWKTYFIFGTFNFTAFFQIYLMYPETAGRSLMKSSTKATYSLQGRLEEMLGSKR